MKGYYKNVIETKKVLKDGKLRTGDLATIDEDGFIFIKGRKKNMIKVGGFQINPEEIEHKIKNMPGVQRAHVTYIEGGLWSERIVALVEPMKDSNIVNEESITSHLVKFSGTFPKIL